MKLTLYCNRVSSYVVVRKLRRNIHTCIREKNRKLIRIISCQKLKWIKILRINWWELNCQWRIHDLQFKSIRCHQFKFIAEQTNTVFRRSNCHFLTKLFYKQWFLVSKYGYTICTNKISLMTCIPSILLYYNRCSIYY